MLCLISLVDPIAFSCVFMCISMKKYKMLIIILIFLFAVGKFVMYRLIHRCFVLLYPL